MILSTSKLQCLLLALLLTAVANAATPVTLPFGVQPKDYTLRAVFSVKDDALNQYTDNNQEKVAKIAINGSDIYVAGLSYFYPEAYVKGTLASDGTATFPSGQFVGADLFSEVYISSFTLDSNSEVVTCDFKLHYNAEADILTYDRADLIFIGETGVANGTEGDLLAYIKGATYTPRSNETTEKAKVEVPATAPGWSASGCCRPPQSRCTYW